MSRFFMDEAAANLAIDCLYACATEDRAAVKRSALHAAASLMLVRGLTFDDLAMALSHLQSAPDNVEAAAYPAPSASGQLEADSVVAGKTTRG